MSIGDRIRAWQEARANGERPILDALGIGQQQAAPAPPRPVQNSQPSQPRSGGGGQASQTRGDPQVFALQQQLQAAGFSPGPIDGIMGPQTRAAMQAMQAAQAPTPPVPPSNPQRGPVPLPRPRPEPVNSGMGSYNPAAPMNYAATANIQQQGQIAPPPPGSLAAGQMTPVPQAVPANWRPTPEGPGVPHTQRWTQNRPGGSVGSQDGDPDRAAIYDQPDITGAQRAQYAAERDMRTEPAPPPPWTPNGDAFLAAEQEMIRRQDEAARQAALAQPYTPPNLGALLTAAQNIGAGPPPELTPLEMARLGQLLRVRRDDTATMPAGVVPPRNLGALIAPGV